MKVLISVNFLGFLNFLWDDLTYFQNKGYEITVTGDYELGFKDETLIKLKSYGAQFVHIPTDAKSPLTKKNIQGFIALRSLIKKENFHLIVCHTAVTGMYVRLAAIGNCMKATKVIYMTHGLSYNSRSSWKDKMVLGGIERLCSWFTNGIITINDEDYNNVKKYHCKKVWKINGVGLDLHRYTNVNIDRLEYRHSLGFPNDKIVIVTAGELSVRKNHQVIVKAISLLPNKEKYLFAICGRVQTIDGRRPEIIELAEKLGVDVRMLGYRDDLEMVFHCCDIGTMPSLREGLGMAGIQMLCAGLPIVGSAVQGIKEYCLNEKTGYLVDNPHDAKGFAQAILKLSDKVLREKMKNDCIEISKTFSKENSIYQRKIIYDSICDSLDN